MYNKTLLVSQKEEGHCYIIQDNTYAVARGNQFIASSPEIGDFLFFRGVFVIGLIYSENIYVRN